MCKSDAPDRNERSRTSLESWLFRLSFALCVMLGAAIAIAMLACILTFCF